jgi:hypothetical protein
VRIVRHERDRRSRRSVLGEPTIVAVEGEPNVDLARTQPVDQEAELDLPARALPPFAPGEPWIRGRGSTSGPIEPWIELTDPDIAPSGGGCGPSTTP